MNPPLDRSIFGLESYIHFQYRFDEFSALAVLCVLYTIPTFFVLLKMIHVYIKSKKHQTMRSLNPEVFRQFLIMQVLCLCHVVTKFTASRFPQTGLITAWCAAEKPQLVLKIVIYANYMIIYSKYVAMILFCGLRVALMHSINFQQKTIRWFPMLTMVLIPCAFCLALPRLLAPTTCAQLGRPFPFGSVIIMTFIEREARYRPIPTIIDVIVQPITLISILLLNGLMLVKIHRINFVRKLTQQKSKSASETVLTTTMILIILPVVLNTIACCYECFGDFHYLIYLIRPFSIDAQSHVITCYFYFTHPVFRPSNSKTVFVKASSMML
ncbi:Serpentine Receptor, class U [Caenorhabditis elegans]|uniref:Serpentine Receptor, class U n=2 Tax=Caenorhabditis elegans TaxID=6239 RepID=A0A0M9JJ66_CAEEL|nr:Serpentine Receptor, class U [Caenorhabditis elegans]CUR30018.1 Serpentine Receptor, class U [Caenorhabditis elegans]|eukprot:NP_001303719.1 Uncharacterized protein CELE_C45H4.18 [Caenorhabditis elegans]